jgi:hypothetical protein
MPIDVAEKDVTIIVIDDNSDNIRDLSTESNRKKGGLVGFNIQSPNGSSYSQLLGEIFFSRKDGVLIDIDLDNFGFHDTHLGNNRRISNGIDIALLAWNFSKETPIAIYTTDISKFRELLSEVPTGIQVFEKTSDPFEKVLAPFIAKVKQKRELAKYLTVQPYSSYLALYDIGKVAHFRTLVSRMDPNVYFEIVGDYSWVVYCSVVQKSFHGSPVFYQFSSEQSELAHSGQILTSPEISQEELDDLGTAENQPPYILFNLRNLSLVNASIQYFSDFVKNLSSCHRRAYEFQLATNTARLISENKIGHEELKVLLSYMAPHVILRIQIALGFLLGDVFDTVEDFASFLEGLYNSFPCRILEIFTCQIESIDQVNRLATTLLENIFDDDIHFTEEFDIDLLRRNGIVPIEYSKFSYVVYENENNDISSRFEPLDS